MSILSIRRKISPGRAMSCWAARPGFASRIPTPKATPTTTEAMVSSRSKLVAMHLRKEGPIPSQIISHPHSCIKHKYGINIQNRVYKLSKLHSPYELCCGNDGGWRLSHFRVYAAPNAPVASVQLHNMYHLLGYKVLKEAELVSEHVLL